MIIAAVGNIFTMPSLWWIVIPCLEMLFVKLIVENKKSSQDENGYCDIIQRHRFYECGSDVFLSYRFK
jgi:hypothetical protein